MFEIYCINLKERNDRMEKIYNIFANQKYFEFKRFNAIKNQNGALGCLCSHLEIIKDNINKPYVIVIEDDLILNDSIINIYNIIDLLIKNISKWTIFNGSPTFYNFKQKNESLINLCGKPIFNSFQQKKIVNSKIKNIPFVNINWGQSTSFIIYSNNCYNKLITLLEKEKVSFNKPIDILISENFIQTTYLYGFLFSSSNDYSNIEKIFRKDVINYMLKSNELLTENVKEQIENKSIDYIIGIYSIFIGDYTIFYKDFIESINKNLFPGIKKKIFIVTNKDLESNENTYILKISNEYIQFPFPTLFRFKYFRQIPISEYKDIDYMFFINANTILLKQIDFMDFPIYKNRFLFILHDGYYKSNYVSMPFEKNNKSSAFIPFIKDNKYTYIGGRFFGASLIDFKNLFNILYNNILYDLKNNYIAIWHDESHLNHFFYHLKANNYFLAGIEYHTPEEQQIDQKKKIIYLDKTKILNSYPKNWLLKKKIYTFNAGNKITNELITFYQD